MGIKNAVKTSKNRKNNKKCLIPKQNIPQFNNIGI